MLVGLVLLKENRVMGLSLGLLLGFKFSIFLMVVLGMIVMLYIFFFCRLIVFCFVLKKFFGVLKFVFVVGFWVCFNVVFM